MNGVHPRGDAPGPDMSRERFRSAMSRLGAAVNLVTTDGPAGRRGLTVSAVCSVTDDPPMLLACINRASGSHRIFEANGCLCVNVLGAQHDALSLRFANRDVDAQARFSTGQWTRGGTGAPVLADALAVFDCRIESVQVVGTHSVFFCRVLDARRGADAPGLVWFERGFRRVES